MDKAITNVNQNEFNPYENFFKLILYLKTTRYSLTTHIFSDNLHNISFVRSLPMETMSSKLAFYKSQSIDLVFFLSEKLCIKEKKTHFNLCINNGNV